MNSNLLNLTFLDKYQFLNFVILGNSLKGYLISFCVFLISLFVLRFFQNLTLAKLSKLAGRTKTDIDDTFIEIAKSIKPPFYLFLAFWIALQFLNLNPLVIKIANGILIIWITYQAIEAFQILMDYVANKKLPSASPTTIDILKKTAKGILWAFGLILILSNLGINVSSLIAGLGIGGIAIALAMQNILSDLFSSFAIYFDKPFEIGDFIVVGDDMGTVEKIGIKTTRVRSLQGEELVISNRELTSARIHNFKKMDERRVVSSFGIAYETPLEKVKEIPSIVRSIFEKLDMARLDRVHFKQLGDSALIFEMVYFVKDPDYLTYLNSNQDFLLSLLTELSRRGVEIAYPTQTVHLVQK